MFLKKVIFCFFIVLIVFSSFGVSFASDTGTIYVVGGDYSGGLSEILEVYDPKYDSWTTKTDMPTARQSLGVTFLDEKIYAIGGYNGSSLDIVEVYNPETDSWSTVTAMPTARRDFGVTSLNGKVYAIGGYNSQPLSTVEVYDGNDWTRKANMPTARYGVGVSSLNGKIYAVGGVDVTVSDTVSVYDPQNNSWSTVADMPTARDDFGATSLNGKLYAVGGHNPDTGVLDIVEVYNPEANSWSTVTDMPTPRSLLGVTSLNGKLYAIGGSHPDTNFLDIVEVYNPETNSWTTTTDMPTPRRIFGTVSVSESLSFDYSPDSPTIDSDSSSVTVDFTNNSNGYDTYLWEFGNGDTSNVLNPSYSYTKYGTHTVVLNGINDGIIKDSFTKNIYIDANVSISHSPDYGGNILLESDSEAVSIDFNINTSGYDTYLWEFGNGDTSNKLNPLYSYTKSDTYDVKISVIDNNVVIDTAITQIIVKREEIGDFIYVFGGANSGNYVDQVERYKVQDGSWEKVSWYVSRSGLGAVDIRKDLIYYAGGMYEQYDGSVGYSKNIKAFNLPFINTESPSDMGLGRSNFGMASYKNSVYIIGGKTGSTSYTSSVYSFGDSVSYLPYLPEKRGYLGATISNGVVYVVGGFKPANNGLANNSLSFDLSDSSSWNQISGVSRRNLAVTSLNGKIYAIGGQQSNGDVVNTVQFYDPESSGWGTATSLNTARANLDAVSINGKIYAIGGLDSNGNALSSVEVYNPETNSWNYAGSTISARQGLSSAIIKNDGIENLSFDYSPDSPTIDSDSSSVTVDFTNNSNGYDSYEWAFGDGGTSLKTSPSHDYFSPDTYIVRLTGKTTTEEIEPTGNLIDTSLEMGQKISNGGLIWDDSRSSFVGLKTSLNDTFVRFDTSGNILNKSSAPTSGDNYKALAYNSNNDVLYTVNKSSSNQRTIILDPETFSKIGEINHNSQFKSETSLVYDPKKKLLWGYDCDNFNSCKVIAYDLDGNLVKKLDYPSVSIDGLAMSSSNKKIWIYDTAYELFALMDKSGNVLKTINNDEKVSDSIETKYFGQVGLAFDGSNYRYLITDSQSDYIVAKTESVITTDTTSSDFIERTIEIFQKPFADFKWEIISSLPGKINWLFAEDQNKRKVT